MTGGKMGNGFNGFEFTSAKGDPKSDGWPVYNLEIITNPKKQHINAKPSTHASNVFLH